MENFNDVQQILENLKINVNIKKVEREINNEKETIEFIIEEDENYKDYNENYDLFSSEKYNI